MQKFNLDVIVNFYRNVVAMLPRVSEEALGWLAVVIMHSATLPSMLAYSQGFSNDPLPIDMVLLLWTGLVLLFVRAAIRRDMLHLITIGAGFAVQAGILALTFFR
jgi:hypothetical protein